MARRIVLLETNVQNVITSYEDDLTAARSAAVGVDATVAAGSGAYVVMLVSPTLCVPVYLPRAFINTFNVGQPTIPNEAKFFRVEETVDPDATPPAEGSRKTRSQKSKGTTTDLSRVSYNHIKVSTDGLTTTPIRRRTTGNQKLRYISARFPRVLTKDCINWLITNGFDGGASATEKKLPSHFLYGGSNFRVEYTPITTADLAAYTV